MLSVIAAQNINSLAQVVQKYYYYYYYYDSECLQCRPYRWVKAVKRLTSVLTDWPRATLESVTASQERPTSLTLVVCHSFVRMKGKGKVNVDLYSASS